VAHRKPDNFSVRQSAVLRKGPFTWLCAALITMALIITTATIVYLLLIDVAFSRLIDRAVEPMWHVPRPIVVWRCVKLSFSTKRGF